MKTYNELTEQKNFDKLPLEKLRKSIGWVDFYPKTGLKYRILRLFGIHRFIWDVTIEDGGMEFDTQELAEIYSELVQIHEMLRRKNFR